MTEDKKPVDETQEEKAAQPSLPPKAKASPPKAKGGAPATSLPNVQKRLAAEKKQQEQREEKAAAEREAPEGTILVRLVRPMTRSDGVYLEAGVYHLPEDEVPSSARRLA